MSILLAAIVLVGALDGLEWAIGGRDSGKTLREANRPTKLGANLSATYVRPVPSDVSMLDYEGRELRGTADDSTARLPDRGVVTGRPTASLYSSRRSASR